MFKFAKTWNPSDEGAWDDEAISDKDGILVDYELVESPVLIKDSSPEKEVKEFFEDNMTVKMDVINHLNLEEDQSNLGKIK